MKSAKPGACFATGDSATSSRDLLHGRKQLVTKLQLTAQRILQLAYSNKFFEE